MKTQLFRFTFLLSICLTLPLTTIAQVVDIPDSNLRAAIETALNKAPGCHNHRRRDEDFKSP